MEQETIQNNNLISVINHEMFGELQTIFFEGTIYFNPDTVAKALEYNETRSMLQIFATIPQEDMSLYVRHFTFQELNSLHVRNEAKENQKVNWNPNGKRFLTEPGLFMLMNKSDKPNAYPFQKWVNFEVLPKLKNDGYYISDNIKDEQLKKMKEEIIQKDNLILTQEKQLTEKDTLILTKEKLVIDLEKKVEKYKSNPKYEKTYQKWLQDMIGGEREVRVGKYLKDKRKMKRIDILTDNHIFECKHVSQWEKAITQVMKYKILMQSDGVYKEQKLNVFLFEESDKFKDDIDFIRKVAKESGVTIFYYGNMAGYVDADELENLEEVTD